MPNAQFGDTAAVPIGGSVAWADIIGKPTFGTASSYDVGTTNGQIPVLGASGLPAIGGSLLTGLTKSQVGLGNVDNTSDANKPISTATQTALNLKAPINNPTFTGTVGGITKSMVGLGNVDNTSDLNKPISTATQTALNGKAATSHTHTVSQLSDASADGRSWLQAVSYAAMKALLSLVKADVGLSNVDNTSDVNKPVSTAQQTALDLKLAISSKATGSSVRTGTNDTTYVTPKSIFDGMAYVTSTTSGSVTLDFGAGINFSITLNGNLTLNVPSNMKNGQSGTIYFIQDGTGSRTITLNASIKKVGTYTLSTAANSIDRCGYTVRGTALELTALEKGIA